ncbi:MAG: DUF3419 family protein, partial [Chlamydiia bacterium]|nr:DUF3419 family protein [Chlamydiia bacterium]
LQTYLAKENFMISLVFTGRLSKFDLPPYLDSSYFHAIKNRLDRLSFTCESLFDFFNNPKLEKFSAFSLSDVTSFFDQAGFERLLSGLINASADNAKFCIRQFLTSHFVPAKFEKIFVRDRVLELELEKQDRAFAYRFFVGKIHKA